MPLVSLLLAAAAPACALATPDGCATTVDLLALSGVPERVRALAGNARANYLRDGLPPVADQALEMLGGPAEPGRPIPRGRLFIACRPLSCGEKAALVVDDKGQVTALAILHARCAVERAKPGCGRDLAFALYGGEDLPSWRAALVRWATRASVGRTLPVTENGIGEPLLLVAGEFDGDRTPDEAAVVSDAHGGYTVTVKRGINGKTVTVAPAAAETTLAQGDGGTLLFGAGGAMRQARWTGKAFEVTATALPR